MKNPQKPRRVILKISGEMLGGPKVGKTFDPDRVAHIVDEIVLALKTHKGLEIGIILGGGNIARGSALKRGFPGFDTTTADHIGMLGTLSNALVLEDQLEKRGFEVRLVSAFPVPEVSEEYIYKKVRHHLENKRIVLFAGGLGISGFTTDTSAILRAADVNATAVFKGTKVDGIFESDPEQNPKAKFLPHLTYAEFSKRGLDGILDKHAVIAASEKHIPIHVFNAFTKGNFSKILSGEKIGSVISD